MDSVNLKPASAPAPLRVARSKLHLRSLHASYPIESIGCSLRIRLSSCGEKVLGGIHFGLTVFCDWAAAYIGWLEEGPMMD